MDRNTGRSILIVGAGCFGISTAYHLLKRGYKDITVLDRSHVLPAPDAASTDMNKGGPTAYSLQLGYSLSLVVRSSYADIYYTRLAKEAIEAWKDEDWGNTYHESGVLVFNPNSTEGGKSYENDVAIGSRLSVLEDADAIRAVFPAGVKTASFESKSAYFNLDGGWVYAAQGVKIMTDNVISLGGQVVPGKAVTKLLQREGVTTGVECADGSSYNASLVVLATGSWTCSSFPNLDLKGKCIATGQSLATIQLTPEESAKYRDCPVTLNFGTNFYTFPPNEDNIVKFAVNELGVTNYPNPQEKISTPRTILSHGEDGLRIPKSKIKEMRQHLRGLFPDLAERPFASTRMCWYTDSPDEDWVIGTYPSDPSLLLATGGSGHAYKFLPVIGRVVVDAIEGSLDAAVAKKFAVDRDCTQMQLARWSLGGLMGESQLDVASLCTPEDLFAIE